MASGQQYDLEKLLLSQNREQLDALLRSEYEKNDPDYALIERILAVLEASTEEFNSKPALSFDEFLKSTGRGYIEVQLWSDRYLSM